MRVLVACESSGTVRSAFRELGHEALSCDLLPDINNSPHHIQGDVLDVLDDNWDLVIAFPPCTHLSVSGARWFKEKQADGRQQQALNFFHSMLNAPARRVCVENPVSVASSHFNKDWRKAHGFELNYTEPHEHGHGETKKTGLWTRGLPALIPTNKVKGREARIHKMSPGPDRWRLRSQTYQGIATAMAQQWGQEE